MSPVASSALADLLAHRVPADTSRADLIALADALLTSCGLSSLTSAQSDDAPIADHKSWRTAERSKRRKLGALTPLGKRSRSYAAGDRRRMDQRADTSFYWRNVEHADFSPHHADVDASAEAEGIAVDTLAELHERYETGARTLPPLHPHVRISRMIDTALAYGKIELPKAPTNESEARSLRGWFTRAASYRKQSAVEAMARVQSGGAGKREIVTRQDKVRRTINSAARKLDVLASRMGKPIGDKLGAHDPALASAAIAALMSILRPV
jgi:hypothetical protein